MMMVDVGGCLGVVGGNDGVYGRVGGNDGVGGRVDGRVDGHDDRSVVDAALGF